MLFSSLFTTALCLAGVSAKVRSVARSNHAAGVASRYANLQARAVPDQVLEPSHTTGRTVLPANHDGQSSRRTASLTLKIHAIVSECQRHVAKHVDRIKHHCRNTESQHVIIASILIELEAILVIIKETLVEVKSCGHAPTPSGAPTAQPKSITHVAYIILEIVILLKVAVLEMLEFIDNDAVHQHFSHIFFSITSATSEVIVAVNAHLQGSIPILAQVGSHALSTVQSFGFGFGSILDVVKSYSA